MGRLKKYNTPEEKSEANKIAWHKYYWKNKEARDNQSRIRYREKKDGSNLRSLQENK